MSIRLEDLMIDRRSGVKRALEQISQNCKGLCFVVDEKHFLLGVVADGDIRRGLLSGKTIDDKVIDFMNHNFTSLHYKASVEAILHCLDERIRIIPLVDNQGRLVDFATQSKIRRIPIANPVLNGNELAYVTECINSNWISSQGKFVNRFEAQFSELVDGQYAVAVSNGTVALHLALLAHDVGPGDEVIVPDLTFAATINSVLYTGAEPVIVDVDPETWCMDLSQLRCAIGPKTKAIIPVHLYGHPVDAEAILEAKRGRNIVVIEDCAEALGSHYYKKHVGSLSDASIFSFYGNKTITTGEGGMVLFKNADTAEKGRILRDHGMSRKKKYWHDMIGYNYRMTNIQAAIGVAQMERLAEIVERKVNIARLYNSYFSSVQGIVAQREAPWAKHSYWMYCIRILTDNVDKEELVNYLYKSGIETRPIFYPLSSMPLYERYHYARNECGNANLVSSSGLCLPSSIDVDEEIVERIVHRIDTFLKQTA